MAEKIKGLTYVIEADGSKFEGTMKDLNSILSSTKREMNSLDKALKLDPGNIDLLSQKFKASEKAISLTKNKIEETQKTLSSLKSAEVIDNVKLSKTQADLARLNSDLKKLENDKRDVSVALKGKPEAEIKSLGIQLDKIDNKKYTAKVDVDEKGFSGKLAGLSQKISSFVGGKVNIPFASTGLEQLGSAVGSTSGAMAGLGLAATGIGAAVVAGTAVAMKAWESWNIVDEIKDKISNLNTTTTDFGNSFENLASKNAVGLEETGSVILGITKNFKELNPEQIENFGNKLSDFTQFLGGDPVSNAKQYKSILSSFGQDTTDVNVLNDKLSILSSGIQASSFDAGEFMQAFDDLAPTLSTAGLSIEQSTDLITRLSNAGLDASDIQNGLGKATIKAAESGKSLTQVLDEQIKSLSDGTISAQDMNDATDLFGKKGALSMINALKNGRLNLEELGEEYKDNKDTLENLEKANEDAGESFAKLGNKITLAFVGIGEKIAPELNKIFDGFASLDVGKVAQGVYGLFQNLGKFIGEAMKGLVKHPEVIVGILTLPLTLPAILITGLVDGFVSAFAGNGWKEQLGTSLTSAFQTIAGSVTGFAGWIWDNISGGLTSMWDWLYGAVSWLGSSLTGAFSFVAGLSSDFGKWIWNAALSGLNSMWKWLYDKLAWLGSAVSNGLSSAAKLAVSFGSWIWGNISGGLSAIWNNVWGTLSWLGSAVSNGLSSAASSASGFGSWIWNEISGGISAIWNNVWNAMRWVGGAINSGLQSAINSIGDVGGWIWNKVSGGVEWVKSKIQNSLSGLNPFRSIGFDFGFNYHESVLASIGKLPPEYANNLRSIGGVSRSVTTNNNKVVQRPVFNLNVNANDRRSVDDLVEEIQRALGGMINV